MSFRPESSRDVGVDPTTGRRWSRERINLAISALEAAERAGREDLDSAIEVVETISPEAASVLRKASAGWTRDQKLVLAGILIPTLLTLLSLMLMSRSDDRPTDEQLVVIVQSVCEYEPGRSDDTSPADTPPPAP